MVDLAAGVGSQPLSVRRGWRPLPAVAIGTLTYWLAIAEVPSRQLWAGAVIGTVGWQFLPAVGGYNVTHQLRHALRSCAALSRLWR